MKKVIALLLLMVVTTTHPLQAAEEPFEAGVHYRELSRTLLWGDSDKVEVVEFFWYGCPHCYQFEPTLSAWLADNGETVNFVRVPGTNNRYNPLWDLHAQAYFVSQSLGVSDKTHGVLFHALHNPESKKRLASREEIKDVFISQGVDADAFDQAWNAFLVKTNLNRAEQLGEAYGVGGVPAMAVAGKYVVDSRVPKGFSQMMEVVDFLVKRELNRRSTAE
ncbi:MAG: thiol:disulfide interchange protein DsbA/DsbL [Pseudomonadota bacterium]|nr:thiol:disulfide interchange protein DsbA/DsbL [Pseudomonadota bacterium]